MHRQTSKPKRREYVVRVSSEEVIVEHRRSPRGRTVARMALLTFVLLLLTFVGRTPLLFWHLPDPEQAVALRFLLLAPLIVTLLMYGAGRSEVLRCDRESLHYAQRRMWIGWRRSRFPAAQVGRLRHAVRVHNRNSYTVLTFEYGSRTFDILRDLSYSDTERILLACKSMGLDAVLLPQDVGAPMLRDIDRRGWFLNPLKPEDPPSSLSKE